MQSEQSTDICLSEIIQHNEMIVLELKLCLRNLMLDNCSYLTTDWNIGSTRFLYGRALEIKVSFEADLVEE